MSVSLKSVLQMLRASVQERSLEKTDFVRKKGDKFKRKFLKFNLGFHKLRVKISPALKIANHFQLHLHSLWVLANLMMLCNQELAVQDLALTNASLSHKQVR